MQVAPSRAMSAAQDLVIALERHKALTLMLGCWKRVAEESQRHRREALFDAMAQQIQGAKRRFAAFEAMSAHALEVSGETALLQLVAHLWRSAVGLARERRGREALADWSHTLRETALYSCWAARAFIAWSRARGEPMPVAEKQAEDGEATPPGESTSNWTTEAPKALSDDLQLEDQAELETTMQPSQKNCENHAQKTLHRQSLQRRHSHHSLPAPGSSSGSHVVGAGGSLRVACGGFPSPRSVAVSQSACVAQTCFGDRAQLRTAAGSMSVPHGGCQSACELGHGASWQPALLVGRNPREASPRAASPPPSLAVALDVADAPTNGNHASRSVLPRTGRQPLVAREAPAEAPGPEPKKQLPRGPERFFYDSTTYTGCARFGGPSVVDKENVVANTAGRAKGNLAHSLAGSPRIVHQTAGVVTESTPANGGACQASLVTPSSRRRVVLLR